MDITLGNSVITGKVSGLWNKETRAFEVKRGKSANGKKWQSFEISVSSKKDDKWINGKNIKVMLIGDTKVEHGQPIGLIGSFKADNYNNKEGVEVRGNMFMSSEVFEPKKREVEKSETVPTEAEVW